MFFFLQIELRITVDLCRACNIYGEVEEESF